MTTINLPYDFALVGAVRYQTAYQGQPRLVVPLRVESLPGLEMAVLDTGSTRCILRPDVARHLRISKPPDALEETLRSRFGDFPGWIERVTLTLLPDAGMGIQTPLDVRVFIPEPHPISRAEYNGPTILGMLDLLEVIRFAVDPARTMFYFGYQA